MSSIAVLLSTYNGEKYLKEQIDSILSQRDVDIHLVIRDDGSSDKTISILNDYASRNKNIVLLLEDNVGCEKSFEILTDYTSQLDYDYYAFCDQDDVWFPDKLAKSVKAIQKMKGPALYCCNQMITDEYLRPVRLMISEASYGKILKQQESNYFVNRHGCTMVWNKDLQGVLNSLSHSKTFIPGHDSWVNLVARCSGNVIIGEEPLMYYRIHGANTGGLESNIIKRIKKGIKLYLAHDCFRNDMAKCCLPILNKKSNIGKGDEYVRKVAAYRDGLFNRLSLLFSKQLWQYGKADSIVYALSVLIGNY